MSSSHLLALIYSCHIFYFYMCHKSQQYVIIIFALNQGLIYNILYILYNIYYYYIKYYLIFDYACVLASTMGFKS